MTRLDCSETSDRLSIWALIHQLYRRQKIRRLQNWHYFIQVMTVHNLSVNVCRVSLIWFSNWATSSPLKCPRFIVSLTGRSPKWKNILIGVVRNVNAQSIHRPLQTIVFIIFNSQGNWRRKNWIFGEYSNWDIYPAILTRQGLGRKNNLWNLLPKEKKNVRKRNLSLIHIWRCRRSYACRSRWSPYH